MLNFPQLRGYMVQAIENIIGKVTIGSLIKGYRHSNDLTLDELAKKLKISKAELQKIEAGRKKLSLKEVVSVTKKLDEPKNLYAKVWCEEEVRSVGLDFDDLTKIF